MPKLPIPKSAEDGVYHVYALRYARNLKRNAFGNFMTPTPDMHDGPMPSDYYVWIITNAFRTILVDTGFGARAAAERGRQLDFDLIGTLPKVGIDPDTLEDVILSHLHFDHAGNLDRFAKARLHLQEAEAAFATGRCMCEPMLRMPFDVEDVVALMRRLYADRVVFHDDGDAPFPGVTLHALPGHSMGIQAVRVMTPRGVVVLASDVTHYYANLLRRAPFRITVDTMATLRSYQALIALAGSVERIIPGHDPKVRRIYPLIEVGGVELAVLHEPPIPQTLEQLAQLGEG
jgi:glyoxylase-like metal-dependent hydrolase (beta-lactamase superfamily II)